MEVAILLEKHDIDVTLLQETKLNEEAASPNIPGYDIVRRDRNSSGGGVCTLIKNTYKYTIKPYLKDVEALVVSVHLGDSSFRKETTEIQTVNYYLPPNQTVLPRLVFKNYGTPTIVAGDANAHHNSWHSEGELDIRGKEIDDLICDSNLVVLNGYGPTRRSLNADTRNTSPDVTAITDDLAMNTSWSILE